MGCAKSPASLAQDHETPPVEPAPAETAAVQSDPIPEGKVRINLAWQHHGIEASMKTHFLPPGSQAKLWEMGTSASRGDLPIGEELENGRLEVSPGSVTRFVLLMENSTDAPLYFFAAPHQVNPVQLALGFKFKCLCINHAFEIPPGHSWYRVVELRMDEGFVGNEIKIEHALIGLDEARKKEFELPH
jgi:hypothetical protein